MQTTHKLAVIALFLALFLIPFYLLRDQLGSLNSSAYLNGAALDISNAAAQQPTHPVAQPSAPQPGLILSNSVGQSLIGASVKTK